MSEGTRRKQRFFGDFARSAALRVSPPADPFRSFVSVGPRFKSECRHQLPRRPAGVPVRPVPPPELAGAADGPHPRPAPFRPASGRTSDARRHRPRDRRRAVRGVADRGPCPPARPGSWRGPCGTRHAGLAVSRAAAPTVRAWDAVRPVRLGGPGGRRLGRDDAAGRAGSGRPVASCRPTWGRARTTCPGGRGAAPVEPDGAAGANACG